MRTLLPLVLLVALLLPASTQAESNNSFSDPFSPFNPNSFVAQDRERQQQALTKQRQTWWDRFRQRLDSTWKAPAGTRFFSRFFQRRVEERQHEERQSGERRRWGADIFTRLRGSHVAYNTATTGTGQARFMDKVSRTSHFTNTGGFGKEVQRAVPDIRVGYWDARGGKLMARVAQKVKQLFQQGAHRARRWYGTAVQRRPDDRPAANDGIRRWTVQGQQRMLQHQQLERQRRMSENPNRMIPVWRVQQH